MLVVLKTVLHTYVKQMLPPTATLSTYARTSQDFQLPVAELQGCKFTLLMSNWSQ